MLESATVSLPARKVNALDRSDANGRIADELIRYRYHLAAVENSLIRSVMGLFVPALRELDALFDEKNPFLLQHLAKARLFPSNFNLKDTNEVAIPLSSQTIVAAGQQRGKTPLSLMGVMATTDVLLNVIILILNNLITHIDHKIYDTQLELADFVPKVVAKVIDGALPAIIRTDLDPQGATDQLVSEPLQEAIGGKNHKALQKKYGKALLKIERIIIDGFTMGQSTRTIVGNVKGIVRKELANGAALLARAELQRLAARAERELYARNQDLIKAETWLATLDVATCLLCGGLDGRTFPVASGPTPVEDTHPNCRCIPTPVIKSWAELGVDEDLLPLAARRQLNGVAPERITWRQWFERQPDKVKLEILGRSRYDLYKEDKLDVDDFATNKRVLTIKQLKRRYHV